MPVTIERKKILIARRTRYLAILDEIERAMHKINIGEAQSYTINSIQLARRTLTISDLIKEWEFYSKRLQEVEDELAGLTTGMQARNFLPSDY